jgi:hypothetical protein
MAAVPLLAALLVLAAPVPGMPPPPPSIAYAATSRQVLPSHPEARSGCTRYASMSGSDANPGTARRPFAGPQRLLRSLRPGQIGCLLAGTYRVQELRAVRSGVAGAPITLRSYPGERARIVTKTDFYVPRGIAYDSFVNLDLSNDTSSGEASASMIQDVGTHTVWRGNDISGSDHSTCMQLGDQDLGAAQRTLIVGNAIHDCGSPADGNQDQAIYVAVSRSARIARNVFWATAAYAVQLYPDADDTAIVHNVFADSGYGAVIFASDQSDSGLASDRNTFAYNVVSDSARGIDSWWGPGGVGTGNSVRDNCLHGNRDGGDSSLSNIAVAGDVHADPRFVNQHAHDYRLRKGSRCLRVVGFDAAAQLGF